MIKTVLAPNAPWPAIELKKTKKKEKIKFSDLDYFAEVREELRVKNPKTHKVRDSTTGRFASNAGLAG